MPKRKRREWGSNHSVGGQASESWKQPRRNFEGAGASDTPLPVPSRSRTPFHLSQVWEVPALPAGEAESPEREFRLPV